MNESEKIVAMMAGDTNIARQPGRAAKLLRAVKRGEKLRQEKEAQKSK